MISLLNPSINVMWCPLRYHSYENGVSKQPLNGKMEDLQVIGRIPSCSVDKHLTIGSHESSSLIQVFLYYISWTGGGEIGMETKTCQINGPTVTSPTLRN